MLTTHPGKPLLTTDYYPDDLDTTCAAMTVLEPSRRLIASILDEIPTYISRDGIVLVCAYKDVTKGVALNYFCSRRTTTARGRELTQSSVLMC